MKTRLIITAIFINTQIFSQDGTYDNTFNLGGSGLNYEQSFYAIDVQSDDKIIIGTYGSSYNGVTANNIIRLNANGSLDNTFNYTEPTDYISAIKILNDGNILAAKGINIQKITSAGSLDTSFTGQVNGLIRKLKNYTSGKILVVGNYTTYNGATSQNLSIINQNNGNLDTTFNPVTFFGGSGAIYDATVDSGGNILVGGDFTNSTSSYSGAVKYLARLNPNGTLDEAFQNNINSTLFSATTAICVLGNGKILAATTYNDIATNTVRKHLVKFNADGTLDTTFNAGNGYEYLDGSVYSNTINKILELDNGKILIIGMFEHFNGVALNSIARLNSDGTVDATFNSSGLGAQFTSWNSQGNVYNLAQQSDKKIVLYGTYNKYNNNSVGFINRINFSQGFLGIDTLEQKTNSILIYPNPFTEILNISTKENRVVYFYDLSGKLVSTSMLMKGNNQLQKSSLNKGIYIYQIKNTNGEIISSGKLIKN